MHSMKNTSFKATNHLGSQIDKLAVAGHSLPSSLTKHLNTLQTATDELKSLLIDSLPDEILQTLLVVSINDDKLTLAVQSTTAANHLTYLKQPLIKIIKEQSASFTNLNDLKIRVVHSPHNQHHFD